jgi:predicted RNA-binding protein
MAMQGQYSDDRKRLPGKRPRLMIDISPELRRRIKIAAAEKDLSIREYVEDILEQVVPPEKASMEKREPRPVSRESLERLLRTREQIIQERQGQPFTDSTEIIRQMREERSEYLGKL